jgi:hypothetical protein
MTAETHFGKDPAGIIDYTVQNDQTISILIEEK